MSAEQYEAYMKQQDATYKTEVVTTTTAVVQEPAVIITQYELEQRKVAAPAVTYIKTEKVCFTLNRHKYVKSLLQILSQILGTTSIFLLQELMVSTFEERIIQEVELRIMRISYTELMMEDGEQVTTEVVVESGGVQPAFHTPLKNYRIVEGMGVTFHCRMTGTPLPKVQSDHILLLRNGEFVTNSYSIEVLSTCALPGTPL